MELIEKYIGHWGRYQAYIYCLFVVPFALSGIQVMSFTFTGAIPKTRCYLPGLDGNTSDDVTAGGRLPKDVASTGSAGFTNQLVMHRLQELYTKPKIFRGNNVYCQYCPRAVSQAAKFIASGREDGGGGYRDVTSSYYSNYSSITTTSSAEGGWCSIHNFSEVTSGAGGATPIVFSCGGKFIFDRSQYRSSLAVDFKMVCEDDWKRSLASSFFMFGFLIGASISGTFSDRFGRRPVFLALSFMGMFTYPLVIFVPNYTCLCILHVLNGSFCHGAYITAFVMVMEYISGPVATVAGVWIQGIFTLGYIYVGLCAYLIRDWKWLQFAVSVPALGLIPLFWLVPESIRWLIVHGRSGEAKKLIVKAAKVNRTPIVDESQLDKDMDEVSISQTASVIDLLSRHRSLTMMTLIIFYCWFATSMNYFGISLNTPDLPGNDYLIYVLSGLVEIGGIAIAIPMLNKYGRRPSVVLFFGFGGVAVIACAILPKSFDWGVVTLAMIGKMAASASFATMFNYSVELFPTVARNAGVGFGSSCARIASISAPQIYLLGQYTAEWVPFCIYGLVSITAAFLCLALPETLNLALPESLADGVLVARKQWTVVTTTTKSIPLIIAEDSESNNVVGFQTNGSLLPDTNTNGSLLLDNNNSSSLRSYGDDKI